MSKKAQNPISFLEGIAAEVSEGTECETNTSMSPDLGR